MTLSELSRYYKLQKKQEQNYEILASLQNTAHAGALGAQVITGMPHASGVRDIVGDLVVEIEDVEAEINRLQIEMQKVEREISDYIETISRYADAVGLSPAFFTLHELEGSSCHVWGQEYGQRSKENLLSVLRHRSGKAKSRGRRLEFVPRWHTMAHRGTPWHLTARIPVWYGMFVKF